MPAIRLPMAPAANVEYMKYAPRYPRGWSSKVNGAMEAMKQ